jgi:hypothetical protein
MTKATRLAAALLTGGLALGAYTAGFGPAGAAVSTTPTTVGAQDSDHAAAASETYKNEKFDQCLDDYGGTINVHDCDGSEEQMWTVTRWNDGTVRLKNGLTGDCLADTGGTLGTASNCTTSEYQSWIVKHWNDGTMRFKNEATGQCVEAGSGYEVWSSTSCDSSEEQSWS